jgi:hypothetical protein
MDRMHMKPDSFRELFRFIKYANTTGLIKDAAMKQARAAYGT